MARVVAECEYKVRSSLEIRCEMCIDICTSALSQVFGKAVDYVTVNVTVDLSFPS